MEDPHSRKAWNVSVGSNRLKSIFVAVYMIVVLAVGVGSVAGLLLSDFPVAWAGALLTVLPFVLLYLRVTRSRTIARTSPRLPVACAVTLAGAGLAAWVFLSSEHAPILPLAAALAGTAGFLLFDFWYSTLGREISEGLSIGRTLPDFHARDLAGNIVHAADLRGRAALFMFYRGNWCPFCMAQVREITGKYRALADLGVELVLISPQPTELTERVAGMFQVPCRFWVDEKLAAASRLGIVHEHGVPAGQLTSTFGQNTVLPTVIIVDRDGRIIFTDQTDNYRVRPDPDRFLRVLQAHVS